MKILQLYKIPLMLITLGMFAGYLLSLVSLGKLGEGSREVHMGTSSTGLTNPLLECNLGKEYLSDNSIRPFRQIIENQINNLITEKKLTQVSYYFRDLNNGSWFGFKEKEEFSPGSLFKVPLLLYALIQIEKNPALLNTRIVYMNRQVDLKLFFQSKREIEIGKTYSIKELLEYMIVNSDNNATAMLLEVLGSEKSKSIFQDLGIAVLPSVDGTVKISVRDYAIFFRVLYNASYLSQSASEEALLLLTKTEFKDGIVAGLPPQIKVAHKFGERGTDHGEKQLHDCGTIYAGKSPYLLCIMTRGDNFLELGKAIAKLSQTTFEAVESQIE